MDTGGRRFGACANVHKEEEIMAFVENGRVLTEDEFKSTCDKLDAEGKESPACCEMLGLACPVVVEQAPSPVVKAQQNGQAAIPQWVWIAGGALALFLLLRGK